MIIVDSIIYPVLNICTGLVTWILYIALGIICLIICITLVGYIANTYFPTYVQRGQQLDWQQIWDSQDPWNQTNQKRVKMGKFHSSSSSKMKNRRNKLFGKHSPFRRSKNKRSRFVCYRKINCFFYQLYK